MDQGINNKQTELWHNILSRFDNGIGSEDAHNLQQLVSEFPQSGLLRALLAYTSKGDNIQNAAAYFDPATLYTIVKQPHTLATVNQNQIMVDGVETINNKVGSTIELQEEDEDTHPITDETTYQYTGDEQAEAIGEQPSIEQGSDFSGSNQQGIVSLEETETVDTKQWVEPVEEEVNLVDAPQQADASNVQEDTLLQTENDIEDEVYEEIVGIENITIEPVAKEEHFSLDNATEATDEDIQTDSELKIDDEADKLIVGNIAATDYFMFDKAFGKTDEDKQATQETDSEVSAGSQHTPSDENLQVNENDVSRYHDEKLPYSFLWWLDKTRKEHAGIYRPFAAPKAAQPNVNSELEQQYYENIFHITSVEDLDKHTAGNAINTVQHKTDKIIDKFITEEPQIKPSNHKLDNENKAKKSSEDGLELVTETLANIYVEQMLYPKAIAVYKKLILKFPEKSRYFADRISELEKKTI